MEEQEEATGFEIEVRKVVGDEDVLRFMDSTDSYLTLLDSLSSTLRQGWLDLAIARQSMGASRINGALLDHKLHSAATSVQVDQEDVDSMEAQPRFILRKWASVADGKQCYEEQKLGEDKLPGKSGSLELRHRGDSQLSEEKTSESGAQLDVDDQVQKERAKLLSMFGTLISPKLRSAQLSFETALETLVKIANMRSTMLSSYDRVRKELDHQKDDMVSVPSGLENHFALAY
ncbi:hypothetical protein H0E87_031357 [Populus deltoides]|uniref:Vacuolar ATPase assembly protein VMA22 n=1 Tax=Populus deltoides TaxID=3696 RepID=A0A8T2WGL1_POPDE|nr:hypothetical protein H0E87_031357 [Populus deltoides]